MWPCSLKHWLSVRFFFLFFPSRSYVYKEIIPACTTRAQIRIGFKTNGIAYLYEDVWCLSQKRIYRGLREITFTVNRIRRRRRIIMLVGVFLLLHQQPGVFFPPVASSRLLILIPYSRNQRDQVGGRGRRQGRRVWELMIFKRQDRIGASSSEAMLYNFIISLSDGFLLFSCETIVLSVSPEGFFPLRIRVRITQPLLVIDSWTCPKTCRSLITHQSRARIFAPRSRGDGMRISFVTNGCGTAQRETVWKYT